MYKSESFGKGGMYAKVVADSIANGIRITTLELQYPRFIHAEFMTHRMFSRNASSSRAIPVDKLLEQIREQPAMPIHWGKNKPGMQAAEEQDTEVLLDYGIGHNYSREEAWLEAANWSRIHAKGFSDAGYHKQIVNRLTEPFQFIKVVVTATEWENFFNLRLHPDAQPEIYELARIMADAMDNCEPEELGRFDSHLPYVTEKDRFYGQSFGHQYQKLSAARCARVSYQNHDKSDPDIEKDIKLHDMLQEAGHMSPFEHQASPMEDPRCLEVYNPAVQWEAGITHVDSNQDLWSGNFRGWIQYRKTL